MEDRSSSIQVEYRQFSAPWKQQILKINQNYQFHSAFRLKSIYLALRNGLPAIAMNEACLSTILQGKLQALLTSNCMRKDTAHWKRCLISLTWECTLITQLRTLKFMLTTTTGQAEPEALVVTAVTIHILLMPQP